MSSYLDEKTKQEAISRIAEGKSLENCHLLALAQQLAIDFYALHGHVTSSPNYDFANSSHPQERRMWAMALHAVGLMRNCDIFDDYIDGVENE